MQKLYWYELIYRLSIPNSQPKNINQNDYNSQDKYGIVAYLKPLTTSQMEKYKLREWSF